VTARVIDLQSHRRKRAESGRADCRACRPESACYPHRLEDLTARLRVHADALLIPVSAIEDALDVITGITRECLPENERPAR
jgi:hypothetical protein